MGQTIQDPWKQRCKQHIQTEISKIRNNENVDPVFRHLFSCKTGHEYNHIEFKGMEYLLVEEVDTNARDIKKELNACERKHIEIYTEKYGEENMLNRKWHPHQPFFFDQNCFNNSYISYTDIDISTAWFHPDLLGYMNPYLGGCHWIIDSNLLAPSPSFLKFFWCLYVFWWASIPRVILTPHISHTCLAVRLYPSFVSAFYLSIYSFRSLLKFSRISYFFCLIPILSRNVYLVVCCWETIAV